MPSTLILADYMYSKDQSSVTVMVPGYVHLLLWIITCCVNVTIFTNTGLVYFATIPYCLLYDPVPVTNQQKFYVFTILTYLLPILYLIWKLFKNVTSRKKSLTLKNVAMLQTRQKDDHILLGFLVMHVVMWFPIVLEIWFGVIQNSFTAVVSLLMIYFNSCIKIMYCLVQKHHRLTMHKVQEQGIL